MKSWRLFAVVLLVGGLSAAALQAGSARADRIDELLVRMGDKDSEFRVDELQALSPEELSALCDRLLPETLHVEPPLGETTVRQLVAQLGVASFERRQAAERQLTLAGPDIARWLGDSDDAEVQARLAAIRRRWLPRDDLGPYVAAWERFVHDADARHLALFADRAARAIERSPPRGARRDVIAALIARLIQNTESADAGRFAQMLPALPVESAADMVKMFGQGRPRNVYPQLLLQALDDPRPPVVKAAIAGSYRAGGTPQSPDVQRRLQKVLAGADADLQFAAAGPLFVDFGDPRALRLLLDAARSDDKPRWRQALDAIGNQANFGRRAPANLAAALEPVLQSKDADRRYAAINALGVFADESVWPALVSALGDDDAQVAAAARRHLQSQPDREGIVRRLTDARQTFPAPAVRDAAQALLDDLAREG